LGAATAAVSRSGASSLAEFAAMRLPVILVPYPSAADNHQWHNAQSFVASGAAWLLEQRTATPAQLAGCVERLVLNEAERAAMGRALERWDAPHAAEFIADRILATVEALSPEHGHGRAAGTKNSGGPVARRQLGSEPVRSC